MSHALQAFKLNTGAQSNLPLTKALGRRAQLLASKNWWKICFVYGHDPTKFYREISYNNSGDTKPKTQTNIVRHQKQSTIINTPTTTPMESSEKLPSKCNTEAADSSRSTAMSLADSASTSQRSLGSINDCAKLFPRNMPSIRRSRRRLDVKKSAHEAAAESTELQAVAKQSASKCHGTNGNILQRVDSSCHKSSISKVTKLTPRKLKAPNYGSKRQHCRRTPFTENKAIAADAKQEEARSHSKEWRGKCKAHCPHKGGDRTLGGDNVQNRQTLTVTNALPQYAVKAHCENHNKQTHGSEPQQEEPKCDLQAHQTATRQPHTNTEKQHQTYHNQQHYAQPLKLSLLPHDISLLDVSAYSTASAHSCAINQADNDIVDHLPAALPSPSVASQTHSQQSSLISYDLSRSTSRQSCFDSLPNVANVTTKRKEQALSYQPRVAASTLHQRHHHHLDDTFLSSGISCGDGETQSEASFCDSPARQFQTTNAARQQQSTAHSSSDNVALLAADVVPSVEDVEDALIEAEVAQLTANLRRDEEAAQRRMPRGMEVNADVQTKNDMCTAARKITKIAKKVGSNAKIMSTTVAPIPEALNVADLRNLKVCRSRNAVWMLSRTEDDSNNNSCLAPIPDDAQLSDIEEQLARLPSTTSDEVDKSLSMNDGASAVKDSKQFSTSGTEKSGKVATDRIPITAKIATTTTSINPKHKFLYR
ncbi:unnamed protein product [Ceratitis capitata]|uniref:(Mediterranean fruit fly) hypothetical protein n=1 Tax=Ceratitis capitata TaxID=7213 RepID=A0A811VAY2_CERCA|nr:unnamed protein product [Ceratitis capitata]